MTATECEIKILPMPPLGAPRNQSQSAGVIGCPAKFRLRPAKSFTKTPAFLAARMAR